MKSSFKLAARCLAVQVLAAACAQSAQAAIANGAQHLLPGDANSASSGELFLSVWDETAALSYSVDLGVTVEDFLKNPYARTWHLDQRFKDLAALGHSLQFNIAANNTYGGIAAAALGGVPSAYGVASSVLNDPTSIALANARTGMSGSGLQQLSTPIQARANYLDLSAAAANGLSPGDPVAMTDFAANLSETTDGNNDPYNAYFATLWGTNLANRFAFSITATVRDASGAKDQTLRLYFFGLQGPGVNKVRASDLGGGSLRFGLDANQALLAWTPAGRIANHRPVANPGMPQRVLAGALATLDGSGSYDPDPGDTLTYAWSQVSGPAVGLAGADTATPSFAAGVPGSGYQFLLTVTDGQGAGASRAVKVVVPDRIPIASVVVPSSVVAGASVTLDGSGSYDPDPGDTLSYAWSQQVGPATPVDGANTSTVGFTAGAAGSVYWFTLVVTDDHGKSSVGRHLKITVK